MKGYTALIDCGSGNLHSAEKAFQRMAREVGAGEVLVTSRLGDVYRADRVVLPGDGAFPACRHALMRERAALWWTLREVVVNRGRPFMGICIGMQLLATRGLEHGGADGFDWISGEVAPIEPTDARLKVPHMGWNDLVVDRPHPVMDGVATGDHAYFVHSHQMRVSDAADLVAHADYGGPVTAVVARDTMVGTQFHPEKSQATGLRIISNFLQWRP